MVNQLNQLMKLPVIARPAFERDADERGWTRKDLKITHFTGERPFPNERPSPVARKNHDTKIKAGPRMAPAKQKKIRVFPRSSASYKIDLSGNNLR